MVTMLVSMTTRDRRGLYTLPVKRMPPKSLNRSALNRGSVLHYDPFHNPQVALCKAVVTGSGISLIKQDLITGEEPVGPTCDCHVIHV